MRIVVIFGLALLAVQQCTAPPVIEKKKETKEHAEEEFDDDLNVMEYHRYLREVVTLLETDQDFRAKLEKASEDEIKSGNFAKELEYVNHTVRTQLDELKRNELERLRHLATQNFEKKIIDTDGEHIDVENPHTFEVDDLRKLIAKTTKDLAEVDRKRREEFQLYEMRKKYEEEEKKKKMNKEEKEKYEAQLKALEEKHKKHKPLHHPGSKQQLEEVWEEADHMDNAFDPKTFFYMHDLDGNGVWDQVEVNALFLKELDKLYKQGGPETDIRERREEMERMREHVFSEVDANKDNLISYDEFFAQSKKPEFEQDKGWESLDEAQIYTEEDYRQFEQRQHEEMQRRISMGISPPGHGSYDHGQPQQFQPQYGNIPVDHAGQPHPDFVPPMGARVPPNQQFQDQHLQYQGQQQQFQGQQQQFHGQQPPLQGQQHIPQYQQVPHYQGQGHPVQGQLPQQNYHQGQVPQHQQGQIPQYQQMQVPAQQQQQQGQIPQKEEGQIQQHQQVQVPAQQQQQQQHERTQQANQQSAPSQQQQQQQQQHDSQEKSPMSNEIPQNTGQNSLPVVEKAPQSGNVAVPPSPNVVQT